MIHRLRYFFGFAVLFSFVGVALGESSPNIVYIMADDLGYGDLGCYGQERIQTPNLDRFAKEGMRFTQVYAGSTVCAPSRCALMTGLHTGHCRVRGNALVPLLPGDVTVAELLAKGGYSSSLIGKWGLGEPKTTGVPNKQGFDYFFGYLNQRHAHNYYPDHLWRNETKVKLKGNVLSDKDQVSSKTTVYSHDLFAKQALAFLDRPHQEPFFLYLAYTIPHANNERGRAEGNGMEVPSDAPYSDKPWPKPQKNHAAMITRLDRDFGAFMQKLKDKGLDENTIVFFTSDNGPHKEGGADPKFFGSSGPLRGYKRDLTDGGIRVPMMVRWPGKIKPGVNDHPWAFWDFLPTACELAEVDVPKNIDGVSVVPTLLGKGEQKDSTLYWEFYERGYKQAGRIGDWKAIRLKVGGPIQLYNVKKDIGEKDNVAVKYPDVVKQFEKFFEEEHTPSKEFPVRKRK